MGAGGGVVKGTMFVVMQIRCVFIKKECKNILFVKNDERQENNIK